VEQGFHNAAVALANGLANKVYGNLNSDCFIGGNALKIEVNRAVGDGIEGDVFQDAGLLDAVVKAHPYKVRFAGADQWAQRKLVRGNGDRLFAMEVKNAGDNALAAHCACGTSPRLAPLGLQKDFVHASVPWLVKYVITERTEQLVSG
jgi:hypothetical protein